MGGNDQAVAWDIDHSRQREEQKEETDYGRASVTLGFTQACHAGYFYKKREPTDASALAGLR